MLTEEVKRKAPEETLRDVQPLLDEAGVTRLADITGMDRIGIPVFSSIRPDSKCLAVDSGKGTTKEQAKCSAAMEAIERWAHDEYLTKWQEPHGTIAYKFPMVQGAVLSKDFNHHKWYQAFYYTSQEGVYVPYYHVYNYEKKLPLQEMCWQSGTNGLAIGNTREEAILHGVYEIIERDAVTIWMSDRGNRIDEQTVIDPVSRDLLNMCFEAGVEACIYDVTSDISVSAFICIMVDAKADIGIYKGYRCNLDRDLALQGAICEAAQARAVFLSGARDDRRWTQHMYESQPKSNRQWLYELDTETKVPMSHKNWTGLDLSNADKISLIEERLIGCGCGKVIVADIMERKHAHVVKVMSEGLEGYWNPYLQLGRRANRE
jgi:ribosomal protein S12 methylthiotransferase accessory factor